ncbi:hypothetical protein RA276_27895, partial [Pseudomonas syringae pv. tagetis]|uniref:hypothetical protein n=1 Tax=Pseudomonas syringae group genomosp. 7 TaxID=251699 RepID=UPI00376FBAA3
RRPRCRGFTEKKLALGRGVLRLGPGERGGLGCGWGVCGLVCGVGCLCGGVGVGGFVGGVFVGLWWCCCVGGLCGVVGGGLYRCVIAVGVLFYLGTSVWWLECVCCVLVWGWVLVFG